MFKRLLRRPVVQAALASLLGRYLAFALRTTRWTLHGAEHFDPHAAGRPAIVAFWHERLPMMAQLWLMARARGAGARAHVLVSRHNDGRLIGEILRRFSVEILHGSSGKGRGGAAALRAMLGALAAGDHVVITPDGPRGPRRVAAPGLAQLAAIARVVILPCAAQTSRRRVLPTWDRMILPLPWGHGALVCGAPIEVTGTDRDGALARITAALTEAAETADRLVAA